ncbi:Uma2 family endonuclease [Oribacterium sp. WCC10]|uniref:Uma2 family endonuclease n=1 Tax=Oribacterium sp. WCC10 TaxID=1855343 RepID=UPI0008E8A64B|nr:Uma2 family endonuclease [Oribacterium sp. WCC10]SFG36351.1 Endonuclease, Uma2 family (restriction endonuclease fold) [Oribacterium sp. WCC10]
MYEIGPYTIEDNQKREDRTELIDGNIYTMKSYLPIYGVYLRNLYGMIRQACEGKEEYARPFMFVGVRLDKDDKTCIVPDICVVRNEAQVAGGEFVEGAPAVTIEFLGSDLSDRKRDLYLKLMKYHEAGVKEYWIIDVEHKALMVYDFGAITLPKKYTFEDVVPADSIMSGFRIDFNEIEEKVKKFFELAEFTKKMKEKKMAAKNS